MCGIFGVVNFAGITPNDLRGFRRLLELNRKRGDVAVGTYDGKTIRKYTRDAAAEIDIIQALEKDDIYKSNIILGHVRAPTHGFPVDDANNHPFEHGKFVLAHNGIIFNYQELRAKFPGGSPAIVTDSFSILTTIVHKAWPYVTTEGYVKAVTEAIALLKGSFACWVYAEAQGVLMVFNNISPIHVYAEKDSRLIFSSESFEGSVAEPNGRMLVLDFGMHAMYTHSFKTDSPYDIH